MTREVHDADREIRDIARKNLKDWITHRFSEIRDAAGLTDVTVHVLRHTTASRLIQAGFELVKVRDWLGHKDIKTTLIYAHLAPTQLNAGRAILERLQLPEDDNVIDFDKRRISED
jgi:site-specific recombinase XerD